MDISDFPISSVTPGLLALFQTSGIGTPATTTYQLAISANKVNAFSGVTIPTVESALSLDNTAYYVPVDTTSGGFAITLPSNPADGDEILFKDISGACATNSLTLVGTVDGTSNPTIIDVARGFYRIRYNGHTTAWDQIQ